MATFEGNRQHRKREIRDACANIGQASNVLARDVCSVGSITVNPTLTQIVERGKRAAALIRLAVALGEVERVFADDLKPQEEVIASDHV